MTEIIIEENLLECAICLEQLDENCKMLPCQHTYCKHCLERIYELEGSLVCVQCRKTFPSSTVGNPVDALPRNLVLLNLIEQVKRNPPRRPQNEDDELQTAITYSIEAFHKETNAVMLLEHNEQLQTQLAMESSKRDVLLKNAQDMSEEFNELFLSQKSLKEELFKRTQQNDSIQRRLRNLLENLNSEEKSETVKENEDIVDELNKKLNEMKFLQKKESRASEPYTKSEKNYFSQPHQSSHAQPLHTSYPYSAYHHPLPSIPDYGSFLRPNNGDFCAHHVESFHLDLGGKPDTEYRDHHCTPFPINAKSFKFNRSQVAGSDNQSKSLILPDVRDYDQ